MFSYISILIFSCLFTALCLTATSYTVTSTEIKDLESNTESDMALEAQAWTITSAVNSPVYSTCGGTVLLGGYGVFNGIATFSRLYSGMQPHNSITVEVAFWLIDIWSGSNSISFLLKEGSTTLFSKSIKVDTSVSWPGDLCGSSANDIGGIIVSATVPHSGTDLNLFIQCSAVNTPTNGACGFRDVDITLSQDTVSSGSLCSYADSPPVLTQPCICGQYQSPSLTCEPCNSACATCFGSTTNDCASCNTGYIFNGASSCIQCVAGCTTCTGSLSTECTSCDTGNFLYPNSTCITGCTAPYHSTSTGGIDECVFACSSPNYVFYSNNASCEPSCLSPFIPRQEGLEYFCDSPCSQDQFVFPSGSCSAICPDSMKSETINQVKYCLNLCQDPSMYYYTVENTCKSDCSGSYTPSTSGSQKICTPSTEKGTLQVIKETTDTVLNVGLIISSIASLGDSFTIIDGTVSRMFQYIRYLDISYSQELQTVLLSWSNSLFSIKVGNSPPSALKEESMYKPLQTIFTKYTVYPSFLANFWNDGLMIWSTFCLFLCLGLLEYWTNRTFEKRPRLRYVMRKLRVICHQFLLMLAYTTFGDIMFYSVLEYRSTLPGLNLSKASLSVSILQMLAGLGIFGLQIKLIRKKQKILTDKNKSHEALKKFRTEHEGCQVFFHDFKDQLFTQYGFLLFFISRSLLIILLLTTLFEYPLVQTIIIVVLNVLMLIFLILKRPFKNVIEEVQQLTSELALLVVNGAVLSMAVMDAKGYEATSTRQSLGYLIIILNIVFNFASLVFLAVMAFHAAKDFYKERKKRSSNKNTTDHSQVHLTDSSRSSQLPIIQLSTSTLELDSTTKLTLKSKKAKIKHAQTMGKLKHEGETKVHPENSHGVPLQISPKKPPLSTKGNIDLETPLHSNKVLKKAISISNVNPYETKSKANIQKTKQSRHNFYEHNSDISLTSRDSERSLINNHEDIPPSAGLKKSLDQEIKRTQTYAEKPDSTFKSQNTDSSPTRIDSNRPTFKHSNTTEIVSSVPNLKSIPIGLENKARDSSPLKKSTSAARFNHALSLRSNDMRAIKDRIGLATANGNEESAPNSQAVSFAAELARKINLKQQGHPIPEAKTESYNK